LPIEACLPLRWASSTIGMGTAASRIGMLLALFYRDSLKNIQQSLSNLLKVNVVFTCSMRQINQIDASFTAIERSSSAMRG
jgi:hypothetical protein